jgi:hypothetical protein
MKVFEGVLTNDFDGEWYHWHVGGQKEYGEDDIESALLELEGKRVRITIVEVKQ